MSRRKVHYLRVDWMWRHVMVKGEYAGREYPIYWLLCRPNKDWSQTRRRQLDKAHDVSEDAGTVTCLSCIDRLAIMMEEELGP